MYVDTSGMDKIKECPECENYHNGVRATGAMPILGWIFEKVKGLRKKKYKPIDDDIFMIGL
jgi:hypothetical protein